MHLATQTFSNAVGTAMATYLPRRSTQAAAILTLDKWFDVFNSPVPVTPKRDWCGFGVCEEAFVAQTTALQSAEELIQSSSKFSSRTGKGRTSLPPFQNGMLRCISSLRGLNADLHSSVPQLSYLLTSRLNQDCVENVFSQLGGMYGANQTPDSAEARARLQILLIAPASLVAASSSRR